VYKSKNHTLQQDKTCYVFWLIKPLSGPY